MPTSLQYPLERSRGLQQKWARRQQGATARGLDGFTIVKNSKPELMSQATAANTLPTLSHAAPQNFAFFAPHHPKSDSAFRLGEAYFRAAALA